MSYLNTFDTSTLEKNKERLALLTTATQPKWGKMNAAQMLAHLNVSYLVSRGELKVKVNPIVRFLLKTFVKNTVVGNKPYAKNGKTASYFLIVDQRDFEAEKKKLIDNMQWVLDKGSVYFENRATGSFGKLTAQEWSVMFQKHIDHHFKQFGI